MTLNVLCNGKEENDDDNNSHSVCSEASNDSSDKVVDQGRAAAAAAVGGETTLAVRETKSVGRLKRAVWIVLIASAIGVALTTYFYLSRLQEEHFNRQFNDEAHKVLEAVGTSLDKTLGLLDSIAVAYVSHAQANNDTWPFVTLPNFALKMAKVLPLSDAFVLSMVPIVTPEQRGDWEAYSVAHDDWVDETMAIQESWGKYNGPITYHGLPNPKVHGDDGDIAPNVSRILLPGWQTFPVIANDTYTYNWDWLSTPSWHKPICLNDHKAVVSDSYLIPGDPTADAEAASWSDYYDNFIDAAEDPFAPISSIWYPIIDETNRVWVAGANGYNSTQGTIVGVLVAEFYWRSMFRDILPEDSNGIHVNVSTTLGAPFVYQIDGPKAVYVGGGFEHGTKYAKYNNTGIRKTLGDLRREANYDSTYTGAKLDETGCPITLHLYPSDDMRDRFITHSPLIFTFGALLIFAFCLLVFYLFDVNVERRQTTVMKTAVRSSAIVSDLFPAAVRDRLYPTESTIFSKPNKKSIRFEGMPNDNVDGAATTRSKPLTDRPNAELYPETTILFADLAGFTFWCSTRQPAQVFHLLETLYGAFDAIAKQRGVYKVETIGDCYVAAVGLPTPRRHHAVVMARFAADCRTRMRELIVTELETTSGAGTAALAMRIGLHSGPIIGGVLRGEKSRFQLFGDTVNTASRMESHGERNKIHISQATAELIERDGKGHWLTQRNEKIEAKGKGKMITFWCEPLNANPSVSVSTASGAEATAVSSCVSTASEDQVDRVDL